MDAVEQAVRQLFKALKIQDTNPEVDLAHTPARMARMYREELFIGYDADRLTELRKKFTVFNKANTHELVVIKAVPFYSLCAHHWMPFYGTAALGYLPSEKVIGLSKFPRVVKHFSRRLQTQENLTSQIADFIMEEASPEACIVLLKASHLCCAARGIERPGVEMVTSAIRPKPFPAGLKDEFYHLLS